MIQPTTFRQFQDFLSETDGYFHVPEKQIPVEQQIAYFQFSNRVKQENIKMRDEELETLGVDLYNPESTVTYKRRILAIFATSGSVLAYRLLERYVRLADREMQNWAYMALMEGRIILESEFSDEKQIYISTGMGGKGQKLRYYLLVPAAEGMTIEGYRRDVVEREFTFALQHAGCDIERLTIHPDYADLVVLMPIRTLPQPLIDGIINECNQYGHFMAGTYTITNVKEMSEEEIRATLHGSHGKNFLEAEQ